MSIWTTLDTVYNDVVDGLEVCFKPVRRKTKMEMNSILSDTDISFIDKGNRVLEFIGDHYITINGLSGNDLAEFLDLQSDDCLSELYQLAIIKSMVSREHSENLDSQSVSPHPITDERPATDAEMEDVSIEATE